MSLRCHMCNAMWTPHCNITTQRKLFRQVCNFTYYSSNLRRQHSSLIKASSIKVRTKLVAFSSNDSTKKHSPNASDTNQTSKLKLVSPLKIDLSTLISRGKSNTEDLKKEDTKGSHSPETENVIQATSKEAKEDYSEQSGGSHPNAANKTSDSKNLSFKGSEHGNTAASKPFTKPPGQIRKESQQTMLQQLSNFIPSSFIAKSGNGKGEETKAKRLLLAKRSIDNKTRGIVENLKLARSSQSKLKRLEELCSHLRDYPEAKTLAVREKVLGSLLILRDSSVDVSVASQAREALALVGWCDPVSGYGVRILSLDGGGTRGLVGIEILKEIEKYTQKPIHELFDYICGVSTGALIGLMVGVFRIQLSQAEDVYKEFSREMFKRNFVKGTSRLITSHAYYETDLWESILKENVGWQTFLQTARDPECPKISCVSSLMNCEKIQNFLFRNYTYAPGVNSHYPGYMEHRLWESIRASSAAPGYYEEFTLGDFVHQDGGVLTNNPTAIALHECKMLWPNTPIQCVVSVGTGRYEPTDAPTSPNVGLKTKLTKIVQSATDTEAVHTVLNDLLPPSTYFRFNPYMSEEFTLDEVREDKWEQMQLDSRMYARKNSLKLNNVAKALTRHKLPHHRAMDWFQLQRAVRS